MASRCCRSEENGSGTGWPPAPSVSLRTDSIAKKKDNRKPHFCVVHPISDGHLTYTKVGMKAFGQWLSNQVGRTVVDRTELAGNYDFSLEWTPDLPAATSGTDNTDALSTGAPSLFSALREQLGLKLESRIIEIEFLVIDQAEKPSEN
jgi:uncharacterized protein (TIGR03435 family)